MFYVKVPVIAQWSLLDHHLVEASVALFKIKIVVFEPTSIFYDAGCIFNLFSVQLLKNFDSAFFESSLKKGIWLLLVWFRLKLYGRPRYNKLLVRRALINCRVKEECGKDQKKRHT